MRPENGQQPAATDSHIKGIVALIIATLFFASQDAITKHLVVGVPIAQIICIRFFAFSLFALAYAARTIGIRKAMVSQMPYQQLLRGFLIVSEVALFSWCLRVTGIAQMHAIFACFPLVITALSVPMLGEQVGRRRWLAVGVGFIGTLIIIQPGVAPINIYSILVLVCAVVFAVYNLVTRKVSRKDHFETSLLYFGLVGFAFSLLGVPFYWQPVNLYQALWLLAISVTSIAGHWLLIKALQLAPAVILQPFNYFVLIWASLLGFLIYGEVLDTATLVGVSLVVMSGVYIARREYRLSREA